MTDTQTPERIWAWLYTPAKRDEWQKGGWDDESDRKTTEYIRKDLAKPTVKPLEWSDYPAGSKCKTDSRYNIKLWGPEQLWVNTYTTMRRHETLKEAKAAAQADYEQLVLSALEDTWTP